MNKESLAAICINHYYYNIFLIILFTPLLDLNLFVLFCNTDICNTTKINMGSLLVLVWILFISIYTAFTSINF